MIRIARAAALLAVLGFPVAAPAQEPSAVTALGDATTGTEETDRCAVRNGSDQELTSRAGDHYSRGAVLYEQGDYRGAIREFVSGYCDKPDSSMFYNIGQTYERLPDYGRAVAYFERYLRDAGDQEPNRRRAAMRVEVLRNLPGRITVATEPPNAEVTLASDSGVTARTLANREQIPIRRGTYRMRVALPGYEPIEQKILVEIGQPYSYYLRLEPRKGTVRVVASPPDARLFLDDRLVGIGSYVETVPIGSYTLTVEREGRQTQHRNVVVAAERTSEVGVALADRPRSGRRELIAAATIGVGLTSAATLGTLLGQDAGVSVAGTLVGLGLGFGAAYLGIPEDVPIGHSSFIIGSTVIGATEGLLMAALVSCEHAALDEGAANDLVTCNDAVLSGVALTGGAAGLVFSALVAPRFRLDAGDAALINSGALWGTAVGALFYSSFDADERIREPLLLAGLNVGLAAGATLAARASVSRGRMGLIDLSGLAGIVAGVALGQSLDSSDERLNHLALLGLATGLIGGSWLTQSMDEPGGALGTLRPAVRSDGETTTFGLAGAL